MCAAGLLTVATLLALPARAQYPETDLRAKTKVFADAGGVTAIKRDSAGLYYLLSTRGNSIQVFGADGARLRQFPAPATASATGVAAAPAASGLVFGEDLDVTCTTGAPCLVYIADRGGNAIRVFTAEGALLGSFSVVSPISVAGLPDGEVAVATLRAPRLVQVFDSGGKLIREFGMLEEIAQTPDFNRFLNIGRLATDTASHLYYSFSYVPEPTVRKYDRFGYALYEAQLATLDFQPTSQAARREISRQDRPGRAPVLNKVVNAIGVDPEKQEVWLAVGGLLVHLDAEGGRRGTYRVFTAEGARIEPSAILVEPTRLLIGSETLGVFEFPRSGKPR